MREERRDEKENANINPAEKRRNKKKSEAGIPR